MLQDRRALMNHAGSISWSTCCLHFYSYGTNIRDQLFETMIVDNDEAFLFPTAKSVIVSNANDSKCSET